jgi:hypothetical protein
MFATPNDFVLMPVDNAAITRGHPRSLRPRLEAAALWRKPVWRTGGDQKAFFRILPLETDTQNSTPRGSLLAVMNADREQFNQRTLS